jgi:hypothetical protein
MSEVLLVGFALLAALAVAWGFAGDRRFKRIPKGNVARPWILISMAGLAVGLGIVGWCIEPIAADDPTFKLGLVERLIAAAYLAVQQILLNAPVTPGQGVWIQASRIAAIATVFLLAYEAATRLFAASILRAWLAWRSDHVIVCGLGRTGFQLVRHFRDPELLKRRGERARAVIVVERHADHDRIAAARELGAVVLQGDAIDASLLRRLGAARASDVCFVTSSDETNVEGACLAAQLRTQAIGEQAEKPYRILAHLRNVELATPLEEFLAGKARPDRPVSLHPFNVLERAAMDLVTDRLLAIRPKTPDKVLHAIVYGCGPVAQSVAKHIAEYAHFENLRRTRLTLVHSAHEESAARRFRADVPQLFPQSCEDAWQPDQARDDWAYGVRIAHPGAPSADDRGVRFVANGGCATLDGAPTCLESLNRLVAIATRGDAVPCVFICGENDEQNCTTAFELRAELDGRLGRGPGAESLGPRVHVFAYVPRRQSYTKIARREGLITFGNVEETCSFDAITWSPQRLLAEHCHRSYCQGECPPFWTRERWERRSNLSAAGHVHAKLAVLDLKLVRAGTAEGQLSARVPPAPFSEPHQLLIARMEHNRWMAERLLYGWTFGDGSIAARQRMSMVDWDHLSEADRTHNLRQAIELANQCTQANGFELVRVGEPGAAR